MHTPQRPEGSRTRRMPSWLINSLLLLLACSLVSSAESRVGSTHWSSVALNSKRQSIKDHSAKNILRHSSKSSAGKYYVPLHNFQNTMYYADIQVGTPVQTFRVMFATGSADSWLPSDQCKSDACKEHVLFNTSRSDTYKKLDKPFNLTYTPGMIVGDTGTDTFHVSTATIDSVPFGQIRLSAKSFQAKYKWFPFDGIIGLSYSGASVSGQTPFFDLLMQRSMLQEHIFSLYLTQSPNVPGSTLLLGGTDPKFHLDEISFFPVEPPYVFWMLNISQIFLRESALSAASALDRKTLISICGGDSNSRGQSCRAVIDSGTSLISGPSDEIARLSSFLKVDPSCKNLDSLPVLAFQFFSNTYPLHPEDYVIKIPVRNQFACFLGLQPYDFPEQMGPMWVLGNVFLRKYYSVYDRKNNQVGFAVARPR